MLPHARTIDEVADRVWVVRHEWLDVNVTVVAGERGLAVVDTLGSAAAARELLTDLHRLTGRSAGGTVLAAVNTHEHWDHTLGNHTLRSQWPQMALHAHEEAAARTHEAAARAMELFREDPDDPHREDVLATEVLAADSTFSSVGVVDLGDRVLELAHPGRGHTAGDLVVRVADADVLLAGDLVEESGPPAYGSDSFPLEWPDTLDVVVGLTTDATVVVPGHGAPVDRTFVQDQRGDITEVAENVRAAAAQGLGVEEALRQARWPFPTDQLEHAVRRGLAQVRPAVTPGSARTLPLA
jgi:glyoxylase-like metal-dependent hydrolase (beta-lactamase superfamily II)